MPLVLNSKLKENKVKGKAIKDGSLTVEYKKKLSQVA